MPWWTMYVGLYLTLGSLLTILILTIDTPLGSLKDSSDKRNHAVVLFGAMLAFGVGIQILVESFR